MPQTSALTLFTGVQVFDGRSSSLAGPLDVLVEESQIAAVGAVGVALPAPEGTRVIDGAGCTLMPGLIDAHWHSMFAEVPLVEALSADPGFLEHLAARAATRTLLRGFTTVRDAGGPSFGLARAIDAGVLPGPRIFPAGAFISQSGGHGDFRRRHEVPRGRIGELGHAELVGAAAIADGVPEVLRASREQLMLGASQLKLMAGGGVASPYDPLDVTQYSEDELRAAVGVAEDWGTYVMVHAYTPRAVQRAMRAGVKSIEHGHLLDEPTLEIMAANETWLSLQPFLDDEDASPVPPASRDKFLAMTRGTQTAYALAHKHGVRIAWGSDVLFDPALAARQGAILTKLARWFTPAQVLTMATAGNGELLALSGPRNPYPGVLGVVEPHALADLLLIAGDPLADLQLLARPEQSLRVIMKGGVIVKDALGDSVAAAAL